MSYRVNEVPEAVRVSYGSPVGAPEPMLPVAVKKILAVVARLHGDREFLSQLASRLVGDRPEPPQTPSSVETLRPGGVLGELQSVLNDLEAVERSIERELERLRSVA
jgi:hypothetical protein